MDGEPRTGGGGRSGRGEKHVRALRPVKAEDTVSHPQNNAKEARDPASAKLLVYFANCCFNKLCAAKSQRQCPKSNC